MRNPNEREDAVTLRDTLSLASEGKIKERLSVMLRGISSSSIINNSVPSLSSSVNETNSLLKASFSNLKEDLSPPVAISASSPVLGPLTSAKLFKHSNSRLLQKTGDVYFEEKNYSRALDSYLDELGRIDEQQVKSDLLSQIGLTYENLDQYDNALKYYTKCLEVLKREHRPNEIHPDIAKCLQNIAIAYRCIGEFKLIFLENF